MPHEPQDKVAQILKQVRHLEIRARKDVSDALSGAYHSVFKGQGMDFEEVREYAPGDEVRAIDWNVTARMDRPFVKTFREERELTVLLVIDISNSGLFGSSESSKREYMAHIAALLAFSASRNNDKIGALIFAGQVEQYLRPAKGTEHILRVLRDILYLKPKSTGTRIDTALEYLNKVHRRRAVVFVLSDFIQSQPDWLRSLEVTSKRHDLIALSITDPHEHSLPNVGMACLEDAETGERLLIDTSDESFRQAYAASAQDRQATLLQSLNNRGIDVLSLENGQEYAHVLQVFFQKRAAIR